MHHTNYFCIYVYVYIAEWLQSVNKAPEVLGSWRSLSGGTREEVVQMESLGEACSIPKKLCCGHCPVKPQGHRIEPSLWDDSRGRKNIGIAV